LAAGSPIACGGFLVLALAILPGLAGVAAGLVLIALGSGALKANASSLLGTLYEKGDALRRRLHRCSISGSTLVPSSGR
jgi:dipeptide/tripeptide permease